MESVLVSVVVPIYNTEKYLEQCIESLINQTYRNIEILLIDDASPDKCPEICDSWQKKDQRIKVIHKQNEGLGMARNTGINNSQGDYILFVDSDDYIDTRLIEEAVTEAKNNNAEIVCYGFKKILKGKVIGEFIPKLKRKLFEDIQIREKLLPELIATSDKNSKNIIEMSACMELISTELIKNNKWLFISEREIISEDVCSLLELYSNVKTVYILEKPYYCYRINENSITHTYNENDLKNIKIFYDYCINLCNKHEYNEETKLRFQKRALNYMIAYLKNVINSKESCIKKTRTIRKCINDMWIRELIKNNINKNNTTNTHILYICIFLRLTLFVYIITKAKTIMEHNAK